MKRGALILAFVAVAWLSFHVGQLVQARATRAAIRAHVECLSSTRAEYERASAETRRAVAAIEQLEAALGVR